MKGFVGSGLQLKAADICKFGIYQSLNCAVIEKRQGLVHAGHLTVLQTTAGIKISLPDCFPATFTAVQQPIPPLSQKNCISKYSNFAMKSLYPTPAFCSRSVMICNVVVESACIGIPKRINGTVVTVECGRIEFAQKNSLSNFVKSYSGFVGIMKESALHRAQAISTPSNLPG